MFEYHTFLHHSQTLDYMRHMKTEFEYHTFLHHSQTQMVGGRPLSLFEYHTFLHHSQTYEGEAGADISLSTIHFYIILKRS